MPICDVDSVFIDEKYISFIINLHQDPLTKISIIPNKVRWGWGGKGDGVPLLRNGCMFMKISSDMDCDYNINLIYRWTKNKKR